MLVVEQRHIEQHPLFAAMDVCFREVSIIPVNLYIYHRHSYKAYQLWM